MCIDPFLERAVGFVRVESLVKLLAPKRCDVTRPCWLPILRDTVVRGVTTNASAIDVVFHKGKIFERYNIGGFNEWKNIDLVKLLCRLMDEKLGREKAESEKLITYVKDRPGHDRRYAIDATKMSNELGWKPSVTFEEGLSQTIDWYLENTEWLAHVTSGEYQKYYETQYSTSQ